MIIDCHGHYTTEPAKLHDYRDAQIAHFEDSSQPAPELAAISDDEIRESIGNPDLLANVQQVADDWPGAKERMAGMREFFSGMAAEAGG